MKTMTASIPTMAAITPWWIDARPRLGPTVRVSRVSIEAGRAPVRSISERLSTSPLVKVPVIRPVSLIADSISATSLTRLPKTMAIEPGFALSYECASVYL